MRLMQLNLPDVNELNPKKKTKKCNNVCISKIIFLTI